jgi:phage tail sheath protein FI
MEDAIYIVDPPSGLSRDGVIKWHNGGSQQRLTPLQSNYCCTYWPWGKIYNAIESKYQYVMPSVIMAAQFCKVDNNYAPWYAPAGETNGYCSTLLDLEVNKVDKRYPNKTDRDNLYLDQNRVNPFLKLRNGNILAYGEKTCQRKNSTLTKIHTRRMLIALKKDLNAVIKGFIFQPTMAENIYKIRSNVTTVMEKYKLGGGVASYNVSTDMNTTETLQQDLLYIAISCVPVGCIEQVEITFTLNKSAE